MDYVLTLIGNEITAVAEEVAGAAGARIVWLDEGKACDIAPVGLDAFDAFAGASAGIDFIFQSLAVERKKKLLVSDMDSTIVVGETIDALAALAGVAEEVSAITLRAMEGELDFNKALEERVRLLKGIPVDEAESLLSKIQLEPGAVQLAATMKKNSADCLLLSGGFEILVAPLAERAGFTASKCNRLEIKDGILTGGLLAPLYDGAAKKTLMLERCALLGIGVEDVLAVGDGANDIFMLDAAGLGICFGKKKAVAAKADAQVQHNDLTALLFMQGYSRSEFV